MISQTNWTGCTHFTGIGSSGAFGNGYIPLFAVIGANYECYYNDNYFSSVTNALNLAIASFVLTANFSSNVQTGPSQLGVQFYNNSIPGSGIESFAWDFDGDGIIDSNEEYPYFVYTEQGSYDVTLTVTMEGETSTLTMEDYITVTDGSNVSGAVAGIWTEEIGTFNITGDISIPEGCELVIQPGVELNFANQTQFNVYGRLETQLPTETDNPIIMTSTDNWKGIVISGSQENNVITNCDISQTNDCAINVTDAATVEIVNNRIFNNSNTSKASILVEGCTDVLISQNIIANNTSTTATPGIKCVSSAITISNNIIVNNTGTFSALIMNSGSNALLENNTIANNLSTNNTPYLCYFFNAFPTLNNNIIINNGTIFFAPFGMPDVTYTCISGGFSGTGNISDDPLFMEPSTGNGVEYDGLNASWWLQSSSPCIDAGDPNSACNDPDGSRNDMGAFGGPDALSVPVSNDPNLPVLSESSIDIYPNPFNPTTSIALNLTESDRSNPISVNIYNIKGQLVKTLINNEVTNKTALVWNGTDNNNNNVSSGMYFTKLKTDSNSITGKMLLLK
ncbi:MAG TPA: right-handed parallel beta-helix repeat-containing protein [Candidatus Cloacimonadota bacterium]|nr:right-handed parallel beta-helix repeat-containing protein [Candidatus Cloacimonadota bacterium]